ncbi:hypothetical protein RRG08_048555 [Elysia crispata]|uniref:Uncharacterized protein n=1 Tax=Elysia crispata TaxID=231223 RepID=A0AAE1EAG2_9GAST|nr:hypothetical protein RRG08_048555 [Elysia crispata]
MQRSSFVCPSVGCGVCVCASSSFVCPSVGCGVCVCVRALASCVHLAVGRLRHEVKLVAHMIMSYPGKYLEETRLQLWLADDAARGGAGIDKQIPDELQDRQPIVSGEHGSSRSYPKTIRRILNPRAMHRNNRLFSLQEISPKMIVRRRLDRSSADRYSARVEGITGSSTRLDSRGRSLSLEMGETEELNGNRDDQPNPGSII